MEKILSILRVLMVLLSLMIGTISLSGCGAEGGTEIGNPTGPVPSEGPSNNDGGGTTGGGTTGEEPSEEEPNPETEPTLQGGGS